MNRVYDQHSKHFSHVSAYVITNSKGQQAGTVAFHYPARGEGRVHCYLHVHGVQMVRDYAGGYGYDKTGAAFEGAVIKLREAINSGEIECYKEHLKPVNKLYKHVMTERSNAWDLRHGVRGLSFFSAV